MADKTVIIKLDVQEAGAEAQLVSLNNKLSKLTAGEKDYELVLKKIAIQEERLSKIQAKRAVAQGSILKETKNTTKVLNKQADATGSATAATMELSRVISDAPYGIRGMANNITQLVSQLGTASTKAGGLGGALKLMGKQLIGPLGVVFAITAVVAAFDFFYGTATKATKAIGEFTKSTYAQSLVAGQYVDILEDLNTKEYDRKVAVQELIKLVPELTEEDLAYGNNLDKVREQIALYSLSQASRIEIDKLVQDNSEILALKNQATQIEAIDDQKDRIKKMVKFISEQGDDVSGFYVGFGVEKLIEEGDVNQIEETFKRLGGVIDKESKPIMDRILELTTSLRLDPRKKKGGSGGGKISLLKTPKEYEGDLFEIEDMLRKFAGKELLRNAKTEEEKNTAKAIIELEGFKKSFQDFRLSEDEKLVEFKKSLEKKRLAQIASAKGDKKRISEINAIFDKTSLDAQEEYELESTISYNNYITGLKAIVDKNKPDLILGELGRTELDRQNATQAAQEKHFKFMLEKYMKYAEQAMEVLGGIGDFINGEFDREMVMEQNKTNLLNNELNKRLANENLSKDGRQAIQDEIARNDEKLRVKQEVIEKKRFKMQKAMDIGMAIMETAVAIMKALSTYGPTPVGFATAGLAAAMGAIQVATIARQKFQTSSSSSPRAAGGSNGGGGGSERAEPSFNIVGRSDDNLLINAIQATFDKPLKAYVVARDVTNQQQLDGIITDKAGT